jgi:hypothetical protein
MERAPIFKTTLKNYLAELADIDFRSRADILGGTFRDGSLFLSFYGDLHRVSSEGIFDSQQQKANFAVSIVLCRYILDCPDAIPEHGEWVTYREFKDAGPLVGYFTSNANKIIETTFADRKGALKRACLGMGAIFFNDPSYDISCQFNLLPRIPVYLRFNDRDDEFPAQASILFRVSAEKFLDMECLAIGGTYLAGMLINNVNGPQQE